MITQIGNHRVKHGDLMNGIDDLMEGRKAFIFYSDPPWGQGNLNYWQTINNRMTGAERTQINLGSFLEKVFELATKHTSDWVFIEYGIKWKDLIISMGEKYGLVHLGVAEPKYRSGSKLLPLNLHIFNKNKVRLEDGYLEAISGTHGFETLRKAVLPISKAGELILDPSCGMGFTAKVGVEAGMVFRGNELNEKRLQKTIDFLQKHK